ncbi:MAG: hypothetical protein GY852_02280 [bacterium]|nr:hypothetical protein [bacterium]
MSKPIFSKPEKVREKLKLPYVRSGNDFQRQMGLRTGPVGIEARERAISFLKTKWGVDFDALELNIKGLWLPRQIARPDGESFLTARIAQAFGIDSGILELTLDCFVDTAYKKSFIKQRILSEEEGTIRLRKAPLPKRNTSLDEIPAEDGTNLAQRLRAFLEKTLRMMDLEDISPVYSKALEMNLDGATKGTNQPVDAVMLKADGILVTARLGPTKKNYLFGDKNFSIEKMKEYAQLKLARPSSLWNYRNIYLLIPGILCPEAAFAVVPFEFDDAKIGGAAFSAIGRIEMIYGLPPLLIPIVPTSNIDTGTLAFVKSKLGKYPELVIFLLKEETEKRILGGFSPELSPLDLCFELDNALSELILRKEIKVR